MTDEGGRAVRMAVAGELRLLDPEVRAAPALVAALLDPEFVEFGASGRRYDATSILDAVSAGGLEDPPAPVTVADLAGVALAPDLVHLTYVTVGGGRRVRRSSLWRRTPSGWRLYFHQGTPTCGAGTP